MKPDQTCQDGSSQVLPGAAACGVDSAQRQENITGTKFSFPAILTGPRAQRWGGGSSRAIGRAWTELGFPSLPSPRRDALAGAWLAPRFRAGAAHARAGAGPASGLQLWDPLPRPGNLRSGQLRLVSPFGVSWNAPSRLALAWPLRPPARQHLLSPAPPGGQVSSGEGKEGSQEGRQVSRAWWAQGAPPGPVPRPPAGITCPAHVGVFLWAAPGGSHVAGGVVCQEGLSGTEPASVPQAVLLSFNVLTSEVVLLCLEVAFTLITVDFGSRRSPASYQREGSSGLYLAGLVYPQRRVYTHREVGGQVSDTHCEILQVTLSERVSLLVGGWYHLSSLRCGLSVWCLLPRRSQRHPETMCAARFFF